MKYIFFALFLKIYLTPILSIAQTVPSDLIQGHWVAEKPIYGREANFHASFNFSPQEMEMIGRCIYRDNSSLSATLNVAISYTENLIQILEARQITIEDQYRVCRFNVQPTEWEFYFDGVGNAVLIAMVPFGFKFKLIRPTAVILN